MEEIKSFLSNEDIYVVYYLIMEQANISSNHFLLFLLYSSLMDIKCYKVIL